MTWHLAHWLDHHKPGRPPTLVSAPRRRHGSDEAPIPDYLVELMQDDMVMALRVLHAATPIQAAKGTARRQVAFRNKLSFWLRVTAAGRPPFEFVYAEQNT